MKEHVNTDSTCPGASSLTEKLAHAGNRDEPFILSYEPAQLEELLALDEEQKLDQLGLLVEYLRRNGPKLLLHIAKQQEEGWYDEEEEVENSWRILFSIDRLVRAVAEDVAMLMLGRKVSDEEMERVFAWAEVYPEPDESPEADAMLADGPRPTGKYWSYDFFYQEHLESDG